MCRSGLISITRCRCPTTFIVACLLSCRRILALPDELLVHIFGHVTEGEALLDRLPLVCKRFRRLARDRSAWCSADATLEWGIVAGQAVVRRHDARLLLRAPALRTLSLSRATLTPNEPVLPLAQVLRRCAAVPRELAMWRPEHWPATALAVLVDRLRQPGAAPLANLSVPLEGTALQDILAQLPGLQGLVLSRVEKGFRYTAARE